MVQTACIKFENYIRSQKDLSLGAIFLIIDTNVNNEISFNEFRSKLHSMQAGLNDDEIKALFSSIDKDNSQKIQYDELIERFSTLNTQQLLKRIAEVIIRGKSSADFIFESNCTDNQKRHMYEPTFDKMVRKYIKRVSKGEISQMFRHFDKGGKSYITKRDFSAAFASDIKDQTFQIQIEDIIKPLATKLKKFNYTISELFDNADSNNNFSIDAQELAAAVKRTSHNEIVLDHSEIKMIDDYFHNRFNKSQVSRSEFIDIFNTKFQNKSDEAEAKKSLC